MSNNYNKVVYGNYVKTSFPKQLVEYLLEKLWPESAKKHPLYKDVEWGYRRHTLSSAAHPIRVLDVGCGDATYLKEGFWCFHFAEGIDSELKYSRYMVNGKTIETTTYTNMDFNKDSLPYLTDSFDIVFTKSVIEHIPNTDYFLKELKRVLKPGGRLIVLTPAWEYNYRDFYNDYTHVKPFHRKGLQDALKINGFSDVNVEYHYHLPWLWTEPWLLPVAWALRLLSPWKWVNKEENIHRVNIRFSQEVQLLGWATK